MTVFISRTLDSDSEFLRCLTERGYLVHGQSLIQLTALPFEPIMGVDWVFFSSQHGVRFFFDHLNTQNIPFHSVAPQWAAIGAATHKVLSEYIPHVVFIGNGDPLAAAAFREVSLGQTVLFPSASQSRQSIQHVLGVDIQSITLVVYHNAPIPNPEIRKEQILVFTSPMNAQAYFAHHALLEGQQVVAIGDSTALALTQLLEGQPFFDRVHRSADASEMGLAKVVLNLFGSFNKLL